MDKSIALANLVRLGVHPNCVRALMESEENVWCSEYKQDTLAVATEGGLEPRLEVVKVGVLRDAQDKSYPFYKEVAKALKIVRDAGFSPYHVVQRRLKFGKEYANIFTVLYIGTDESIISEDNFIGEEYGFSVPSYSYNAKDETLSDYGDVAVKGACGGIICTA